MARKSNKTEPVVETAVVDEAAAVDISTVENMNAENDSNASKKARGNKAKIVKEVEQELPLEDSDEIDVVSLIPNVSYNDDRTSDYYEWEEVGHIEPMTFEAIKAMNRKYSTYFKEMWLKPMDERVIKKLGLGRTYDKYEYLMDEENYTSKNINDMLDSISAVPNGLKLSVIRKIKEMVASGKISDINVIRPLEKKFDIDLLSFIN